MRLPILGLLAVSFAISWVLTFDMKRLAPRLGFVDKPGGRKIHAISWGLWVSPASI